MPSRHRGYVFTLNNYTEDEVTQLLEVAQLHAQYYMFGKEVAPTTGTPHIQGYIYWKNGKSMTASRKLLPKRVGFHEVCKGSFADNFNYCSKSGDVLTNMGSPEDMEKDKKSEKEAKYKAWYDSLTPGEKDWEDWFRHGIESWRELSCWKSILEHEANIERFEEYAKDPWECRHGKVIKNVPEYEKSYINQDCEACLAEPSACGAETAS